MPRIRLALPRKAVAVVACLGFASAVTPPPVAEAAPHDPPPPPSLQLPDALTVEATSPHGAIVSYAATASDWHDRPVTVTCEPAPGSLLPLGDTTAACSATDRRGSTSTGSFVVSVRDTTAPILTVPASFTGIAPTAAGLPASAEPIASFLASAHAADVVDQNPAVSHDAPSLFPPGETVVTFRARDAAGNESAKAMTVTVALAPPASGTVQPQGETTALDVDRTPPGNVRRLLVEAGDGIVLIRWQLPADEDLRWIEIVRSSRAALGKPKRVYRGLGKRYGERGLENGVAYRYLVIAEDRAGNRSTPLAVTALPKALLLLNPKAGSVLRRPPTLVWTRVKKAAYFNLQLYRGREKVLSVWPTRARFALPARWVFDGRRFRMSPGVYRWYVWPGFGPRSKANYGDLLGTSTFILRRPL